MRVLNPGCILAIGILSSPGSSLFSTHPFRLILFLHNPHATQPAAPVALKKSKISAQLSHSRSLATPLRPSGCLGRFYRTGVEDLFHTVEMSQLSMATYEQQLILLGLASARCAPAAGLQHRQLSVRAPRVFSYQSTVSTQVNHTTGSIAT